MCTHWCVLLDMQSAFFGRFLELEATRSTACPYCEDIHRPRRHVPVAQYLAILGNLEEKRGPNASAARTVHRTEKAFPRAVAIPSASRIEPHACTEVIDSERRTPIGLFGCGRDVLLQSFL